MKSKLLKIAFSAAVGMALNGMAPSAQATIIPLGGSTNYFQNFNTLPTTGKPNFSLPGWAVASMDGKIYADDGSSTTAGVAYSYGQSGNANRAIGIIANNGNDFFGANFQNTGSKAISSLNVSFTGEEWNLATAGKQSATLAFQYSLNAGGLTSGTWINVPALSFSTPNTVGAGKHDGTLAANQHNLASTISFLNIPVGSTFWVRWSEVLINGAKVGDGLAIDNFSISAVPEATTYAAGLGALGLLGCTVWKRRSVGSKTV
jgi:hypothetical protein